MHRPDSVLCAIDADGQGRQLVCAARALGECLGRAVGFAHVLMPGGPPVLPQGEPARSARMPLSALDATSLAAADEAVAAAVGDAETMMERLGVAADERQILLGDAAFELRVLAAAAKPAFVVVGTRGRGSLKAAVLGSVSRRLLRDAPCPVMVVPRAAHPTLEGEAIVCGVDDEGRADDAVTIACRLAKATGKPLVLAHVTRPVASVGAHAQTSLAGDRWPDFVTERAARVLGDARARLPERDARLALRRGNAVDELVDLARDIDASALVVATRGRTLAGTALLGSVAQELTTRSPCPVVAVPRRHLKAR